MFCLISAQYIGVEVLILQITYTLKNNREVEQGEYDEGRKVLRLASGRELNLAVEADSKLAKKLIYNKVVTIPEMKLVTLTQLAEH